MPFKISQWHFALHVLRKTDRSGPAEALIIAPPVVQCENDSLLEDAELSRLLSDLATSDPAFKCSLSAGGVGCSGRVGVLADALPTTALQVSAREGVARLLRVSVFPRILEMSQGQDNWDRGVWELCSFKKLYGHALVPQRYTLAGFKLGLWVKTVRQKRARGSLSTTTMKHLDSLGFVWDVPTYLWDKGIRNLEEYRSNNRHVLVPQDYQSSDGFKLGIWVSQKRRAKSKGKLGEEQMKILDDLGFVWVVLDHLWEQAVKKLQEYKTEHGHLLVPRNYKTHDGFNLGIWVSQKRMAKSKGKLGKEQMKILDDLGFVWDVYDHLWEQGISRLQEYKTEHGHVLVPYDHATLDGFKLGIWVSQKRMAKSKGKLGEEQMKSLDGLGFVWDVLDHLWEQAMNRLERYKTEHGHLLVPRNYKTHDGFNLGFWVNQKRKAKSKRKLGEEQMKILDDLGFVWDVYDHLWEQGISRLQEYKTEHGHVLVPYDHATLDGFKLGIWVSQKRMAKSKGKLGKEQMKILDDLGFVWDVLDHLWEQSISRLQEYKTEHGHVLVPYDHATLDGFKLGIWVSQKRMAKSKGKLGEEQMKILDDLGFVWDVLNHLWEQGISRLQEYKTEHGHVLVPYDHATLDGFKLGIWVSQKRMAKSKGKLGEEQMKSLDGLGFVWDVLDLLWQQAMNRLEEYKAEHGHLLVPRNYKTHDGFNLGSWVNQKRNAKSKGKLGEELMKILDDLGFVWDVLDHLWEQAVKKLQEYKTEHGHLLVPRNYKTHDGFNLGIWVSQKRMAKSKGKLGKEQMKILDDLGFVWDIYDHLWEQGISRLQEYKTEHGHVLVPYDHATLDGFKLGIWVSQKRRAKSKGKLGKEQMKILDDSGFVWDVLDHLWEQGISRLQEYKTEHGHVLVPKDYQSSDGFKLGIWVSQKRMAKSKGKLGEEQMKILDDSGFVWDVFAHLWEQGISRLQEYKTIHGHVLVPQDYQSSDGFKLGSWVSRKRSAKFKGKLGEEQMKILDDLGFV